MAQFKHLFPHIDPDESCMELERRWLITGFCTSEDELKVLHDVFSAAVQPGAQKASYIVQFLWRDLTSSFDMIGPYFSIGNSMDSSVLQELVMMTLKAFTSYGFKVSILLCDGASSNLTLMKILSGQPRAQFPSRPDAALHLGKDSL